MANHKSSIKRIRQTKTRNERNRYYAKTMRNAVRNLRKMENKEEAAAAYKKVSAMLDKLGRKVTISKSKLAKHVNKLEVA